MPKTQTKSSARIREKARLAYEVDGESFAQIGRALGYGSMTVSSWSRKAGGWAKPAEYQSPSDSVTVFDPEAVDDDTPDVAVDDAVDRSDQDLRDRLAKLEAEYADLEAQNAELKPTRDISAFLGDRVQWITDNSPEGEDYWMNRAEDEYSHVNRKRFKEGKPALDVRDNPQILDEIIVRLKTEAATIAQRPITEPPSRRVKLLIMRNGMPTIEQIPMEGQINNMAGSLADGIVRYTRKGFKLTDPFLCPRSGCFQPAASNELGLWLHEGYCTEAHRAEIEGKEKSPVAGVQVRDVMPSVV